MDFFDILTLIGGLCLFLFGMNVMGEALERRAGKRLNAIIGKLTTNRFAGFLTGLGVTAVIQSSSATTVMVVGFVNSGLMTLKQSIGVIMGANVGTTVTAWILSLGGIESDNFIVQLFKPMSFTPILALVGIIFTMIAKTSKKKDTGMILLGFVVLMFGMETMTNAVAGLRDIPQFQQAFTMFKNPFMGVLVGAVLTAIIQSSSASVGILQALTVTGQVTYGAAFPIIMGQNIGTCITAILSSFGTNRNAKRVALAHLSFNVIGTSVLMLLLCIVNAVWAPTIMNESATYIGIAVSHSLFNVICTILLFPISSLLEKIVCKLVPETNIKDKNCELDERFFATPAVALSTCKNYAVIMAKCAMESIEKGIHVLTEFQPKLADEIRQMEEKTDYYEDVMGDYLVKLSAHTMNEEESAEAARLLHIIGDLERISDHGVKLLEAAEELHDKEISFSDGAKEELEVLSNAVKEICTVTLKSLNEYNDKMAYEIEPMEKNIDRMKERLRANHISRLQKGSCSIEAGFIWSDILTELERISGHCTNIAGCIATVSQRRN